MASTLFATAIPQASPSTPPPVRRMDSSIFAGMPFGIPSMAAAEQRTASSLYAVASTGEEDHSRCGPECSLHQVVRAPQKAYNKKWRMYDGWDEMAKRVSTAVPLKDGSILQVFPEKRWFASLIAWRATFPIAWETRIHLSSELAALYGGQREMAMAPLALEDMEEDEAPAYDQIGDYKVGPAGDYEEDDYDAIDGGYADDERRVNGYVADEFEDEDASPSPSPVEAVAAACAAPEEPLAAVRRSADEMGFELVSKVQMAIIRDLLKELA
jgi:hypothetical protein